MRLAISPQRSVSARAHIPCEGKDFHIVSSACLDKTLFEALRGLDPEAGETPELIPSPIDQNPCAHWRNPMDMMRQG